MRKNMKKMIFILIIPTILFTCEKNDFTLEQIIFSGESKNNLLKKLLEKTEIDLNKYNDDISLLLKRGFIFYKLLYYDKALNDFQKIIEIDSLNSYANLGLGIIYYLNKNEKALNYINKAIILDSTNASAYYYRALYYFGVLDNIDKKNLRYENIVMRALSDYYSVIKLKAEYFQVYFDCSLLFFKIDSLDLANQSMLKAFQLSGNNPDIMYLKASLNEEYLNYRQALLDYDKCIKIDANKSDRGYLAKALLYDRLDSNYNAIKQYKIISVIDSICVFCNLEIAAIFSEMGKYDSTLYYLDKSISDDNYDIKIIKNDNRFKNFLNNKKYALTLEKIIEKNKL